MLPVANYQGRLTDDIGTSVPDDTYNITFTIHEDAVADTPLWKEEQSVLVINGIFNTKLPENTVTSPFPKEMFKAGRYLSIKIGKDSEMTPRQPLTSTPFTFWSQNSDILDGRTVSDLDDRYVNEGQQGIINSTMIEDGSITAGDLAESYVKTTGGVMSGALTLEDSLSVGADVGDDDDYIYMDNGTDEFLRWDDDPGIFFLSDGLYVRNSLQVGWTSSASTAYSRFGGAQTTHSDTIDAEVDLLVGGSLEVDDDIYADSGNLYLGTDNGYNDDSIYMDDGNELFRWEEDLDDNGGNGTDGGFYFSDEIEVGGIVKAQGDMIVDSGYDFKYETPKVKYLTIPACAFSKRNHHYENTVWDDTQFSYRFTSDRGTEDNCGAYAPVYLPDEAIVTDVHGLYYDNYPGEDVLFNFFLERVSSSNGSTYRMARGDVTSTGNSANIRFVGDNDGIIEYNTITNENAYFIYIGWDPTNTSLSNLLRFYGARITYIVDTVD